ncbi:MAG: hypothetical protein AAF739_00480 [Pseudomonadota bacterium]
MDETLTTDWRQHLAEAHGRLSEGQKLIDALNEWSIDVHNHLTDVGASLSKTQPHSVETLNGKIASLTVERDALTAQVKELRGALASLLARVDEHGVEHWDDDMLPDRIEAIIAASDIAHKALASTPSQSLKAVIKRAKAEEREACAKAADNMADDAIYEQSGDEDADIMESVHYREIAAAIRARSEGDG